MNNNEEVINAIKNSPYARVLLKKNNNSDNIQPPQSQPIPQAIKTELNKDKETPTDKPSPVTPNQPQPKRQPKN